MDSLLRRAAQFRVRAVESRKEFYADLESGQQPHTLFVGCSDSRVVPALITHADPGEMFVVRNIANTVPPRTAPEDHSATRAAIEFAVLVLGVERIVVCGHSNCGGCAALDQSPESLDQLPNMREWLKLNAEIPGRVDRLIADGASQERSVLTEQRNVAAQLEHLVTYPFVRERVEAGSLTLQGWYYVVHTGEVFLYDELIDGFTLVT